MTAPRLPVSVSASLALHVAGAIVFFQLMQMGPKTTTKVISDVDLLIQTRKLAPAAPASMPSTK